MASVFINNVFGYLIPKVPNALNDENAQLGHDSDHRLPEPEMTDPADFTDDEYGIEDHEDWQIVRKIVEPNGNDCADGSQGELDEESGMEDVENQLCNRAFQSSWYISPPPCFTRNAPSASSTNPLENLLIEHPSMSVYFSPVAASSSRRAALYRSAPPVIMEEALFPRTNPRLTTRNPPPIEDTAPTENAVVQRVMSNKKRRRARRAANALAKATSPGNNAAATATPTNTMLNVPTYLEEAEKQTQNEEKDTRNAKKCLAKSQIQRNNLLSDANVPKKTGSRDGVYRCLH